MRAASEGEGGTVGVSTTIGRPRDQRLDAAIVDATIALLAERGYRALSLSAIAERAGTTTAAIYRRWSSTSELVAHAVFRTDGDDVVAETDDLAADLETMVRWSVEKICHPAGLAAIAGLMSEPREERRARTVEAAGAARQVVERLERAQQRGELRSDVDAEVLAALIDGPVLHAAFAGPAGVDDEWIAQLVRVVLDGARPQPTDERRRTTAEAAPHGEHASHISTHTDTSEVAR
jgi:AcrR family transcriptional regulator